MHDKYLGDSFDIVKRFWAERLRSLGTLFAHPRFVPAKLGPAYTALTTIPIYSPTLSGERFGLLLDPHTGIPLPSEDATTNASHASLPFILEQWQRLEPTYMVCFDQSHHRRHDLKRHEQRRRKTTWLRQAGISSFYYVSHAPFLFMARAPATLLAIYDALTASGVPPHKFEGFDQPS